jgi:type 1 fimbriae regulatory protein FimB/type 1 fimbriae regulatory protein FimE
MRKPRLRLVSPTTVNRTVVPVRRPNRDLRTREHLTPKEVERLIEATKGNRWAHRDATMSWPTGTDYGRMLRHACGFALANAGHDTRALQAYLGHKNIQHTVRYTELAPTRFKNFWRD